MLALGVQSIMLYQKPVNSHY